MSRKSLFAHLGPTPGADTRSRTEAEGGVTGQPSRLRTRPILGSPDLIDDAKARPVGVIGQSLGEFSERARRAEEIEQRLVEGQAIIEIDPDLIDPSFVSDRMPMSTAALTSLMEKVRDHGQLNPILVRPHPDAAERFQVAFGHRRLGVAKMLGRSVRAVVRKLSDEELVIAQGQENHEREDLSYIEKAFFARNLERRGFGRAVIMAAMSIYKSDLSNMLSVAAKTPDELVSAIGSAPGIGRRGWIELSAAVTNAKVLAAARKATQAADFDSLESDARFKRTLAAVRPRSAERQAESWSSQSGRQLAKVNTDAERIVLTIDRKKSPEFAEFVLERLQELYREFENGAPSRS